VEGLQFDLNESLGNIEAVGVTTGASGHDLRVSHNIIHRVNTGGNEAIGVSSKFDAGTGGKIKIWNNIIYDISGVTDGAGIHNDRFAATRDLIVYANTIRDCSTNGIEEAGNANLIVRNNIVNDVTGSCYSGTFDTTSDNISDDSTSPDSDHRTKEVTFYNESASPPNLRLSSADTVALGNGTNLIGDSDLSVTDDIVGTSRSTTPDIGAYELIEGESSSSISTSSISTSSSSISTSSISTSSQSSSSSSSSSISTSSVSSSSSISTSSQSSSSSISTSSVSSSSSVSTSSSSAGADVPNVFMVSASPPNDYRIWESSPS
jgi:hypothetical protein